MRWVVPTCVAPFCLSAPADMAPPRVLSLSAHSLAAAHARLAQGDTALTPALARLRTDADRALGFQPASVMSKPRTPTSGDKHDYLSQAPYWWPDPATPKGLPYIRHDGRHNPEADQGTDAVAWSHLAANVETLGLAYYFTGHMRYAEQVVRLIRVWFLEPATRMNPHVRYAQYIPGRNDGRGSGILEMRHLTQICDALALIAGSSIWTEADAQAFQAWLTAYFAWLTESPNGREEAAAKNNHGSWDDVQAAHLALFLGNTDFAREILTAGRQERVARQIESDRRRPLELARTKSLGYSLFNLEALFNLARLGENVNVDWWNLATKDGRSLLTAMRYLAPYADPSKPWCKNDIESADRADLLPLLAEALRHGGAPPWRTLLGKFSDRPGQRSARWHLLLAD